MKTRTMSAFFRGNYPFKAVFMLSNSLSFLEKAAVACFGTYNLSSGFYSMENEAVLSNKFLKI